MVAQIVFSLFRQLNFSSAKLMSFVSILISNKPLAYLLVEEPFEMLNIFNQVAKESIWEMGLYEITGDIPVRFSDFPLVKTINDLWFVKFLFSMKWQKNIYLLNFRGKF
jgi:hypothetical protein